MIRNSIMAALFAACACTTAVAQTFSGGTGTADDPWLISNIQDLEELNTLTNNKATSGKYFKLTNDITGPFTSQIGTSEIFNGNFDGGGHCITVNIDEPGESYMALFYSVINGSVHDLAVDGFVKGKYAVAGIVANPSCGAQLYNLANYADVTCVSDGMAMTGGVVGYLVSSSRYGNTGATIKNCANYGTISCPGSVLGGVIGYSGQQLGNTIEDIANYGRIETQSTSRVAGIIGNPLYNDKIHRIANFGTTSNVAVAGTTGNANPTDMGELFYDKQYFCTSASVPAQEKTTTQLTGEQMKATLGDGWVYADNMLPRPAMGGLENDHRAVLYATPIILAEGDNLNNVSKDFKVVISSGVTWTAKNGNVAISPDGSVSLTGKGEEILTATYGGYSRSLNLNITATTGITEVAADGKAISCGAWYNLAGQRVEKPTKGIYIHDGKKVIFR